VRLAGRVAVISGGATGIGRAAAEAFIREGAAVMVMSREAGELDLPLAAARPGDGRLCAVRGDATSPDDWERVVHATVAALGPVDILVNNSGRGMRATVPATSLEDWDAIVAANLTSVFLGCRAVLPGMLERRRGSIVNVGSLAGETIGIPERAAYCAAKAGVAGLTRAMALDHASSGIRVNVVAPGTTDTAYFAEIAAAEPDPGRSARRSQLASRWAGWAGPRRSPPPSSSSPPTSRPS